MSNVKETAAEQVEQTTETTEAAQPTAKKESAKKEKVADLKKELEKATAQAQENKDLLLRTAAEFDNYKRRTAQEKERIGADTRAATLQQLLPALDNLARATANADAPYEDFRKGVEMTEKMLLDILGKLGLEEIKALGEEFDPNFHYAVSQIQDESVGDNIIVDVFQKGYKIGDNVIRPAMVSVANC
ncbi:MAG: nucleotide exchange factor GrpE [Clostridia bacterium]|nr:nucleotide exchange factor GrpE [Clostridia bacterium]